MLLGACAACTAVACVDLSAPKGPASISTLILPSLFVVAGDVMRDSAGNPAPPAIIAFDQKGDTISGIAASFFLTDSIPRAHFDAGGIIHGDSLGIAHLVGQIGNVQTAVFNLPITVAPDSMARVLVGGAGDSVKATVSNDSAASRGQAGAQVRVAGANNTPVPGVIVKFSFVRTFSSRASSPAVFLTDDSGNLSQVDTTDATGLASRHVTIIAAFLADQTLFQRPDSVIVQATATYRGVSLRGSPVSIVLPTKLTF